MAPPRWATLGLQVQTRVTRQEASVPRSRGARCGASGGGSSVSTCPPVPLPPTQTPAPHSPGRDAAEVQEPRTDSVEDGLTSTQTQAVD